MRCFSVGCSGGTPQPPAACRPGRAFEKAARRRVPRDRKDWPVVALALLLDAAVLTGDNDFLGYGCPI